jgi:type IV pilus assembly protein PilX
MLNNTYSFAARDRGTSQRGTVLLIALILLVALSLAGIALIRSVSTSNMIAGNLAFQQGATHAADMGVETAVGFLEANSAVVAGVSALHSSVTSGAGTRYVAVRQDPAAGQSWDAFWSATLAGSGAVNTLATDAAGNTVSFVIHRLCNSAGAPVYPGCSSSPTDATSSGNSQGAGVIALTSPRQVYYRVTTRVAGPRNTLSYVQVIVAI